MAHHSGGKLMMAGAIIVFIGLCIVLVQVLQRLAPGGTATAVVPHFALDDWARLGRFLILGCEGSTYYATERDLTIELTPQARDYVANMGYEPLFGARPLKRVIQREIQDPLALELLAGRIHDGQTVLVDVADGRLSLIARDGDLVREQAVLD